MGLNLVNQRDGRNGNTLFAPLETEMLCGRSFDRNPVIVYTHSTGERAAHGADERPQLGPLHADGAVDVADFKPLLTEKRGDALQQNLGIYARVIGGGVGKMLAYICLLYTSDAPTIVGV